MVTKYEFVVGIITMVLASILLLLSTSTLIRIYRKKSFRFLKVMLWIIILVNGCQTMEGILILQIFHEENFANNVKLVYYVIFCL